jgi:hypothetical protein
MLAFRLPLVVSGRAGELAKFSNCRSTVRGMGFFWCSKGPDVSSPDAGVEFVAAPFNPLKANSVIGTQRAILLVLTACGEPQVIDPKIPPVPVLVINFNRRNRAINDHPNDPVNQI